MAAISTRTSLIVTDQSIISSGHRGPITVVPFLPASCTATLTVAPTLWTGEKLLKTYVGHYRTNYYFDPSCFPMGTLSPAQIVEADWGAYYYSPAICPQGWITVTTFTSSAPIFSSPYFVTIGSDTTAALCCPSEFSYSAYGHHCTSTMRKDESYVYIRPESEGTGWKRDKVFMNFATGEEYVQADGVPIWWQKTDASALSEAATITPTASQQQLSASITMTYSSVLPSASFSQSNTLSRGDKLGIGIGAPILIIALAILGFLIWNRRNNRIAKAHQMNDHGVLERQNASRSSAYKDEQIHEAPEIDHRRHELPIKAHQPQIPVAELPS